MKTIEPVRDNDVSIQLTIMQGQLDTILSELQALRLERLPASPELIESLLESIYKVFQDYEFWRFIASPCHTKQGAHAKPFHILLFQDPAF